MQIVCSVTDSFVYSGMVPLQGATACNLYFTRDEGKWGEKEMNEEGKKGRKEVK